MTQDEKQKMVDEIEPVLDFDVDDFKKFVTARDLERGHDMTKRPAWCPHQECQTLRCAQDLICGGKLPAPVPHDGDKNTHRFCLRGADKDGGVFDLQVNKGDLFWFDLVFDAMREAGS